MRNKINKTKTPFPLPTPSFSPGSNSLFHILFFWLLPSLHLPLSGVKRYQIGVAVSKTLFLLLLPHHPLTLLQHGVLSKQYSPSLTAPACVPSTGCEPSRTDCSSAGSLGATFPAPACALHELQLPSGPTYLSSGWVLYGLLGAPPSPQAERESIWCLKHALHLLLHGPWGLQVCFSHIFLPPQMLCSFGQKWMCFRATENWLCQTWGAASGAFSKKHPL